MNIVRKKIQQYKCYYCYRQGLYTEWVDGQEISVCLKHLSKHSSD